MPCSIFGSTAHHFNCELTGDLVLVIPSFYVAYLFVLFLYHRAIDSAKLGYLRLCVFVCTGIV